MVNGQQSNAAQLSEALADAVERAATYTVRVNARRRFGASGIAWQEGVILATDHTIERDEDITVTLPDGSEVAATIAGRDPGSDLAVLRVDATLNIAPRVEQPRVGTLCLAVGRGWGENVHASFGIVSAVGGRWGRRRGSTIDAYIQPDLTMYPGFSGGPLVTVDGDMIGINTSRSRAGALTIPASAADKVASQLLTHGHLRRGYLGLTSQPVRLTDSIAATAGQATGLLVAGVEPNSPAATGGIFVGDVIIAIAGTTIADTEDLRSALSSVEIGAATPIRLVRGGELREVNITIGER
jgi:S1-C subfamily serine protease